MGMEKSAHVVTQSVTVRSLVNMSALAVVQALREDDECQAAVELPGQVHQL
jgi:hypothetical protein